MEKIKLAVFHYHFVPGGITTVIKLSLISLLENLPGIEEIALISGRNDNAENLVSAIKSSVSNSIEIKIETVPELDYLSRSNSHNKEIKASIDRTLEKYRGYIYWIHNYHIGKNPVFTKAVTEFAAKEHDEKFFFHIHDFPECSRYTNYKYLKDFAEEPYPSGSNIKYAVLNSRDFDFMKKAGIDKASLFLLPNPVIQNKNKICKIQQDEKKKIKESFYIKTKKIFDFDPEKPVFLYPVRAIRRKNIIEAALIALLSNEGANLIQTLPGISEQETAYSDYISDLYNKGYIKGLCGTGLKNSPAEADLQQIIGITDLVVSSSVMEGFGYIFTDTVAWGKPILSRYLETSEDFMPMFSGESSYFYKAFKIPLSSDIKTELENSIKYWFSAPDSEIPGIINRDSYIRSITSERTVDFSYLPYKMQGEYLVKTSESSQLKSEIKNINSTLFQKTADLLSSEPDIKCRNISEYYGAEVFAENFIKILRSYEKCSYNDVKSTNISEKLLSFFTTENSVRILNSLK